MSNNEDNRPQALPTTPGPWRRLRSSGQGMLIGVTAGSICLAYGAGVNPYTHGDVALIVAAPELRDALKAILPLFGAVLSELKERVGYAGGAVFLAQAVYDDAVRALRKAEDREG